MSPGPELWASEDGSSSSQLPRGGALSACRLGEMEADGREEGGGLVAGARGQGEVRCGQCWEFQLPLRPWASFSLSLAGSWAPTRLGRGFHDR